MASVNELYTYFENAIPKELSCEWDNDGRMCVPCPDREVKKVLICLDINEDAIIKRVAVYLVQDGTM